MYVYFMYYQYVEAETHKSKDTLIRMEVWGSRQVSLSVRLTAEIRYPRCLPGIEREV